MLCDKVPVAKVNDMLKELNIPLVGNNNMNIDLGTISDCMVS